MTGAETVATYRRMVTIREFENHAAPLRNKGTIVCSLHLCNGQEAIAVGARAALGPADTVNATYRGHHWAIACGTPIERALRRVHGTRDGRQRRSRRSRVLRRSRPRLPGRERHRRRGRADRRRRGACVPLRRIRPCRADRVRRRRAQPGRGARGDDLRRHLPPAGDLPLREQRLCRVHADRVDVPGRRPRAAGRRSTDSPASPSTAPTRALCARPRRRCRRPVPGTAADPRSSSRRRGG